MNFPHRYPIHIIHRTFNEPQQTVVLESSSHILHFPSCISNEVTHRTCMITYLLPTRHISLSSGCPNILQCCLRWVSPLWNCPCCHTRSIVASPYTIPSVPHPCSCSHPHSPRSKLQSDACVCQWSQVIVSDCVFVPWYITFSSFALHYSALIILIIR